MIKKIVFNPIKSIINENYYTQSERKIINETSFLFFTEIYPQMLYFWLLNRVDYFFLNNLFSKSRPARMT